VFIRARPVRPPDPRTPRPPPAPAPLTARGLLVLARAAARELTWALPAVAREVRAWRSLAGTIPDPTIRRDALSALARKRGHTDGAALFCILPRARAPTLLALLVACEITWDFLDSVNERAAAAGPLNGRRLHLALPHALDPDVPLCDYYRLNPSRDDGGYLTALVRFCRDACPRLPSYRHVRRLAAGEAWRAQVLALNHILDPVRRDAALRRWARSDCPAGDDASWYELTGAASASLTVHALLALAAEPNIDTADLPNVQSAYNPWISAATTMLDSFVDQAEDEANGDHSYIAHYPDGERAIERVGELVGRSLAEAAGLPDGERHTLIVACMAAMYLSKDSAWTADMRPRTRELIRAGGPLTRLLLPILRLWRVAYSQRST
jgi:tetraprenyl-beta-curcumene synthase